MNRFLLDTHTLIWALKSPQRLSPPVTALIIDPNSELFVSFATLWEISITMALGKFPEAGNSIAAIAETMKAQSIRLLNLEIEDLTQGLTLPHHHRDPFDRLLIAQALRLDLPMLSVDAQLIPYGVKVLW